MPPGTSNCETGYRDPRPPPLRCAVRIRRSRKGVQSYADHADQATDYCRALRHGRANPPPNIHTWGAVCLAEALEVTTKGFVIPPSGEFAFVSANGERLTTTALQRGACATHATRNRILRCLIVCLIRLDLLGSELGPKARNYRSFAKYLRGRS